MKMKSGIQFLAILGVAAGLVWGADSTESNILSSIHSSDQKQIQLGQLAEQKAQNPDVRSFGQSLVNNHMQIETNTNNTAQKVGVTLGNASFPSNVESTVASKTLQMKSGADFDKAYLQNVDKDLNNTISSLESTGKSLAASSQVAQLVNQVLPTLKQQRDQAENLLKTIA